jgi:hypothetical protein
MSMKSGEVSIYSVRNDLPVIRRILLLGAVGEDFSDALNRFPR